MLQYNTLKGEKMETFTSRQLNEFAGRRVSGQIISSLRKRGIVFKHSSELHNNKFILTTIINFKDALDFLGTYKEEARKFVRESRKRNYITIKALQEHLCE